MEEEKFQMPVRRRNFSSFFNLFSLLIRYTICKTFYKNEAITMTDRERIRRIQSGEPEQMNELIEHIIRKYFNIVIPEQDGKARHMTARRKRFYVSSGT